MLTLARPILWSSTPPSKVTLLWGVVKRLWVEPRQPLGEEGSSTYSLTEEFSKGEALKRTKTGWREGTNQNKRVGGKEGKKKRLRNPNKWRERLPSPLITVCLTMLRLGREQGGSVWQTPFATLGERSGKKQAWVK